MSNHHDHAHDDGLEHNPHWARREQTPDRPAGPPLQLVVANAAATPTPSTALHDDAHHTP